MSREEEFKKVKQLIKKHIKYAKCGLFDTRNIVGDTMVVLFAGKYFTLEMCYSWAYYEVFGTTDEEFEKLTNYYKKIGGNVW